MRVWAGRGTQSSSDRRARRTATPRSPQQQPSPYCGCHNLPQNCTGRPRKQRGNQIGVFKPLNTNWSRGWPRRARWWSAASRRRPAASTSCGTPGRRARLRREGLRSADRSRDCVVRGCPATAGTSPPRTVPLPHLSCVVQKGGERPGAAAAGRDQHRLRQVAGADPSSRPQRRQVRETQEN